MNLLLNPPMTLELNPMIVVSFLMMLISFFGFVITYKKYVKNSVNQEDMKTMKEEVDKDIAHLKRHVDENDRRIHHRITELREDTNAAVKRIEDSNIRAQQNNNQILQLLIKISKKK